MTDTSGYTRMRAGEFYEAPDPYLIGLQVAAAARLAELNAIPSFDMERRAPMLRELLGSFGQSFVVSPVTWEYGRHIHLGDGVLINYDCLFLDGADIRIGDGTVVAPRVQFLTAGHPVDPAERVTCDPETGRPNGGVTFNRPITVGRNCWIGAGAIILGGVSIGDGVTIGAGSVVTRDIPEGVVAVGNPCRVVRRAARDGEAANAA
ncbi:MAG TPA: sugar O-acetyltransferase [Devosia sp.]|nr:sugar O-acetyltransferase [Devosia sp.]